MQSYSLQIAVCLILILIKKRWAALVFLAGIIFIPMGAVIEVGTVSLPPLRVLSLVGLIRVFLRSEMHSIRSVDYKIYIFAAILLLSSIFHDPIGATLIRRAGLVIDLIGTYTFFRSWLTSWNDLELLYKYYLILLYPLLVFMFVEHTKGINLFNHIGGVSLVPAIRDGVFRAQGPFAHSILAGTYAASCIPMAIAINHKNRTIVNRLFFPVCIIIIILTVSSGPVVTASASLTAVLLWRWAKHTKRIVNYVILILLGLHIIMKAPVWFLIARIDIIGSSTSYYRAKLIDSAINHISEWWIGGTDYTRHWMVTGVTWSSKHADITNHYILLGVLGGLPLLVVFLLIIRTSFLKISSNMALYSSSQANYRFMLWCLGAALFSHLVSMLSVSYFDQSIGIFYSLIAITHSLNNMKD